MSSTEDVLYQITHTNFHRLYSQSVCPGTSPECDHQGEVHMIGGYNRMSINIYRSGERRPTKKSIKVYHRLTGDHTEFYSEELGNDMFLLM